MLGDLDTINKSKTHDCERNLSPVVKGNQLIKWHDRRHLISLECIPRRFPDKSREGQYLVDVFSTPSGSPREIEDFLLRTEAKKPFDKGELLFCDKLN